MEHLELQDLPQDVRDLIASAVHTLIEGGPRALVLAGLCTPAPGAEDTMREYLADYPGHLVELPDSAELWAQVTPSGSWKIDLPLHNDREGRMDLFLFLDINRASQVVKVTDLYAP